jgi:nitrite reductase/ring-hydroxylating ferredoxin subunit
MENSTNPASNGTSVTGTGDVSDGPWTELCTFSAVPDGEGVHVNVGAQVLAVWRVGEQAFVTDDTCTHGEASLARDGMLDGFSIVCGLHQGEFDIRTGLVLAAPCNKPIVSYPACVQGGHVLAKLERVKPS